MDRGLIIDLETTGLDPREAQIIELGMIEFTVDEDYRADIAEMYGALEDPGVPLSSEIEKLTGLHDRILKGRSIDWAKVQEWLDRSCVVIAHNVEFDRGFLRKRSELDLSSVHWACSRKHIDWRGHGFKTSALNYLAADHGFVNPFAHRALFDCAATFRLIQPYLEELVGTSYEKEYQFSANGAPFETKDVLKGNGYRWNPEARVWQKTVFGKHIERERAFLAENVYKGPSRHVEELSE